VHAPLPLPFQQVGSQQQEQKLLTGGSSAAGRLNNHPSDFEHLLNDTELVTLEKAAQAMHGLEFYHGGRQSVMTFDFEQVREAVRESTKWAESKGHAPGEELYDEKEALQAAMGKYAVEGMAALRAWTCTVMCYVMHNMANRNLLRPVLPYARLLISALHALPVDSYLFQGTATLYRGMRGKGLSDSWDLDSWDNNKKKLCENTEAVPCNFHSFTSFTIDRDAALMFKGDAFEDELRTFIELRGAVGYKLQKFSVLPNEQEVLLEPVFCCTVEKMENPYDDLEDVGESHYFEELKGFRRIYLRALPGISLLCTDGYSILAGGPAKKKQEQCYRDWQLTEIKRLEKEPLVFAPFTTEEWQRRGHDGPLPINDRDRKMSKLGIGRFFVTYRMKNAATREYFAVKMVEKEDMRDVGVRREDVEKEAHILGTMMHKHVIKYKWFYDDDQSLGLVMEWAKGGSLTDLIQSKSSRDLELKDLLKIHIQMSQALDYIHGQGILHRDVKAANVLLANDRGEPIHIKLADFGVAAILNTTACSTQSNIQGGGGTGTYCAPERANGLAYGTKADMWSVGCILVELVRGQLLLAGLYAPNHEVVERSDKYFREIETLRGPALAGIARKLLDRDKYARMSAAELYVSLENIKENKKRQTDKNKEQNAVPSPAEAPKKKYKSEQAVGQRSTSREQRRFDQAKDHIDHIMSSYRPPYYCDICDAIPRKCKNKELHFSSVPADVAYCNVMLDAINEFETEADLKAGRTPRKWDPGTQLPEGPEKQRAHAEGMAFALEQAPKREAKFKARAERQALLHT
jgi:serine/threonine protein kinase